MISRTKVGENKLAIPRSMLRGLPFEKDLLLNTPSACCGDLLFITGEKTKVQKKKELPLCISRWNGLPPFSCPGNV
jgi:hypothetical protein